MALVTTSGYSNAYTVSRWLTECFDPSTRIKPPVRDGFSSSTGMSHMCRWTSWRLAGTVTLYV